MSTTTPTPDTTAPVSDGTAAVPAQRPVETAPSQVISEGAAFARLVGFAGWGAMALGIFLILANELLSPRLIGKGGGYLFAAMGIAMMLYHAIRDSEQEVRRLYGLLAAVCLILAIGAVVVPGPIFSSAVKKASGHNLGAGVGFGLLALLFAIPFTRHETESAYRDAGLLGMLIVGAGLAIGSIIYGLKEPAFLLGPGLVIALLGVAYLCGYMAQVDTSEGIGYQVAFALGAVGAAVAVYAFARSTVPIVLYEGPNALRTPTGEFNPWAVAGRLVGVLVFVGVAALGRPGTGYPVWLRSTFWAIAAVGIGILALASFRANTVTSLPPSFLIPSGVVLIGLGAAYLAVAFGICSDNQFVTLTRRELSSYFLSPIGYLVIGGTLIMQWMSYWVFINIRVLPSTQSPLPEPIVSTYFFALFPVLALLLQVPALTMRLIAEEKRTGSLEVLMTAPVNEAPVMLSKFLATWLFFMVTWLPSGLFLIALRVEGGVAFDYHPLISFYLALGAQGLAFVAIGLFFSTLTRNQIVAAVLTLVAMVFFLLCYFIESWTSFALPSFVQTITTRLSFVSMWGESLSGRLPLRDVFVFVSLAVFFLFLSIKVLEARKWN